MKRIAKVAPYKASHSKSPLNCEEKTIERNEKQGDHSLITS